MSIRCPNCGFHGSNDEFEWDYSPEGYSWTDREWYPEDEWEDYERDDPSLGLELVDPWEIG